MSTLTGPAAGQMQRLLQEKGPSEQGLRLYVDPFGLSHLEGAPSTTRTAWRAWAFA